MTNRTVAMLVNPASGQGRGGKRYRPAAARLRDRGLTVVEVAGGSAAESESLARRAIADGAQALIACGGDGTIHLALQAVANTGVPLGIIPVGTGDDNARSLGIPRGDVVAAADVIADGRTRTVDCGVVRQEGQDPRYFLNVLSIGFDSEVNERANALSWPKGQAKYLIATLAELRTFRPAAFHMVIDGQSIDTSAMLVAVGNGVSYGGGMKVCPDAVHDDGLLDMTVLRAVSKFTFITSFPTVFKGTHVSKPFVDQYKFASAYVEAKDQVVYADGERICEAPATIEVAPGAVELFVPTA